jgi:transcriptional regulator with XRE-family HTH domain
MTEIGHAIDLKLSDRLKDPETRKRFFLAESSAKIAESLIALRKRRGLSQAQVAERAKTHQPAISRAERADYQNWSFSALRVICDALDARIRVIIEPAEDILYEYDEPTNETDEHTPPEPRSRALDEFSKSVMPYQQTTAFANAPNDLDPKIERYQNMLRSLSSDPNQERQAV